MSAAGKACRVGRPQKSGANTNMETQKETRRAHFYAKGPDYIRNEKMLE